MQDMPTTRYHYTESSCAELVLTSRAEREFPWHAHVHHWTIGMVQAGSATLSTRDETRVLFADDSFIVPPNVAHALKVTADTVLAVLCLDPRKTMEENLGDFLSSLSRSDSGHPLSAPRFDCGKLHDLAVQLSGDPDFENPDIRLTPPIRAVAAILQEKPEEQFSLDALSSLAGYSRWHFLRLFQKETGLTPHAYQLVCRLRLLRSLLRADTAAADAAVSAGFSDQSHMHRVFKLHHGLTPKEFKRAGATSGP